VGGYSCYGGTGGYGAGIGSGYGTYTAACNVNISGGTAVGYCNSNTTNTSAGYGAGIGAGYAGANGTNNANVNISGGTVTALSARGLGQGAGIGSSYYDVGTVNVAISGGTVTAYSTSSTTQYGDGAGIGSGYLSRNTNGSVTITSGTLNARAAGSVTYATGAAIGSGRSGLLKTLMIRGGTITAAFASQGAALGAGKSGTVNSLIIDGGSILSVSGASATPSTNPPAKNTTGTTLSYLPASVTRSGAAVVNTAITSGNLAGIALTTAPTGANNIYGINGVKTDASGNLGLFIAQSAFVSGNRGYVTPSGQTPLMSQAALSSAASARFSSAESLYTVSFNAQGGTPTPAAITNVIAGNKITRPANPTSTQSFVGWSSVSANTGALWDFATDVVGGNMTLYALWGRQVNVTFDAQGGSPVPKVQTLVSGGRVVRPVSPTKSGYNFAGWINAATNAAFNFNAPITATITLKATWSAKSPDTGSNTVQGQITALPSPKVTLVSASYKTAKASWTSSTADGFELSWGLKGKAGKVRTVSGKTRTLALTGTLGKTYSVSIRSFATQSGTKLYSAWSAVKTIKITPSAPTGLNAKVASKSSIRLSWKKVAGATHYRLYKKTPGAKKWKLAKTVKAKKAKTNKYTIKQIIKKSGTYQFRIKTVRKVKKKSYVSPYSKVCKKKLKIYR
jgi:uncharacterized repeat protein (TIGR02543 family)